MAWTRVTLLPVGAFSSHTWRGKDESGREALLREVPEGATPWLNGSAAPGIVPLRDVVTIEGRRYGVWDLLPAESLQEVVERLLDAGGVVPLAFVSRIVIDAARSLVAITPMRAHGGLSDGSLLITRDGAVTVMDFGCPRPGRFTPSGAPSFVNDVFALGAVLHASLTGFGGTYADAITEGLQLPSPSQLHDECTPAIDDVVQRAIARSVEQRQPDLELFADELEAVLGDQLFSAAQVAQLIAGAPAARPGPPVPDADPGPAPGIDDVPTGEHLTPGTKETFTDLPQIQKIPVGTQPGTPPGDAFSALAIPPEPRPAQGIPMSTQPGVPGPAMLAAAPPRLSSSVPVLTPKASSPSRPPVAPPAGPPPRLSSSVPVLTPKASSPSRPPVLAPVAPAGLPLETQPRLQVPPTASAPARASASLPLETQPRLQLPKPATPADTSDDGSSTGPRAVPVAASSVSHAKLEWAQTQARVPTPPLGVPALGDTGDEDVGLGDDELERHEPTAIRPIPAAARIATSGTAAELSGVSDVGPSITDVKAASSGSRKLIAVLLVVVAGVFAAMVWKLKGGGAETSTIARVTPVLLLDDDAGVEDVAATVAVAAPEPETDAGEDGLVDADADGGEVEEDEEEDAGVTATEDAGPTATDAGAKPRPIKKKPTKRRRRR
ncbi:MAG: hypothetical protein Q8L14_39125 [Myxococcales bacterium]|nr:hypothetical protein [Myxococcales bacterium]